MEDRNQDPFYTPRRRGEFTRSLSGETTVDDGQQSAPHFSAAADGQANASRFLPNDNSVARSSGLPSVPSICQLHSSELRAPDLLRSIGRNANPTPQPAYQLPRKPNTSMQSTTDRFDHMVAPETNALKEWHKMVGQAREDSQVASTVQYSTDGENERPRNSPSRAFLDHVLQSRRAAATQEAVVKTEDVNQSGTELATQSISNTPDVEAYDQHIQDTISLIGNTVREIQSVENASAPVDQRNESQQSANQIIASQHSPTPPGNRTPLGTPRPSGNRTSNSQAVSIASSEGNFPIALRKLAPRLLALQRHLSAQPNISMTLQNFSDRVWHLENASFGHIPAEEISDKFEMVDGRLLDVEHRLRDLEEQHTIAEERADARHGAKDGSFDSEASDGPMALIAAALGENKKDARLHAIEQRLDDLESAVPSYANPWEIEVVLFPWGRDLKGIWSSQDELDHSNRSTSGMSLGSGDLSQTFQKCPSRSSLRGTDADHAALSDKAISAWASSIESSSEHLFPRSCGPKGKVWYRLKSRGLIRKVTIQEPGARHILQAIEDAFGSNLLDRMGDPSEFIDSSQMTEDSISAPPLPILQGYRSSIIPLRKVRQDHQLQFLPPSELTTPTLWTSEFLSSGVMMDVKGKKRLYATVKCAYMQLHDDESEWSWKQIKDLPRVPMDPVGSEDAQVPEVQAEAEAEEAEPYWDFDPKYDQPYSPTSSFNLPVTAQVDKGSQSSVSTGNLGQLALRLESEKANTQPTNMPTRRNDLQSESVRPPLSLKRTPSAPNVVTAQANSKRRATGSLDETNDVPPPYREHENGKKRRRMNRSPTEEITSASNRSAKNAGDAQKGPLGFTPEPSEGPSSGDRDVAGGSSQGGDAASARANMNHVANNKGSGTNTPQAYNTPFSGQMGMARPYPPDGDIFSDTEPDGEEASDYGDDDGDDQEMTDTHEDDNKDAEDSEWDGVQSDGHGNEESQVDFVKVEDDGDADRNLYGDHHPYLLHPVQPRWKFAHEEEGDNENAEDEFYGIRLTGKKYLG